MGHRVLEAHPNRGQAGCLAGHSRRGFQGRQGGRSHRERRGQGVVHSHPDRVESRGGRSRQEHLAGYQAGRSRQGHREHQEVSQGVHSHPGLQGVSREALQAGVPNRHLVANQEGVPNHLAASQAELRAELQEGVPNRQEGHPPEGSRRLLHSRSQSHSPKHLIFWFAKR